jgi:proline iminopeptidase
VADLERLREHLGIDRWLVFGGSWGSTLALAYAQTHPERVTALVLRGIFLVRRWEIAWFYQDGCSHLFPDAWERYLAPIPEDERHDLVAAYHRRLTHDDPAVRIPAAKAWSQWEARTSYLQASPEAVAHFDDDGAANAFARIECHYFVHDCWLDGDRALLRNVDRIRHLPCVIVQGRYDVVCPMASAWALHRAWPESDLRVVGDAGHSAFEPGLTHELVEATDRFR